MTNVPVAVARTMPGFKGRQEVREVELLYKEAIGAAEKYIYIENQYLTSAVLAEAEAVIRPWDIILEIDREPLKDPEGFQSKIREFEEGDTVLLLVNRKEGTLFVTLKVRE
ncbi:MAG: hypothetical protein SV375_00830 [Thermodesulfobacteriota bacterium]|nr:hypothetical protein [Thermodesulfobacteriota bacterium]